MPLYDFCCAVCGSRHEVRVEYSALARLELICIACGGAMHAATTPGKVALLRFASEQQRAETPTQAHGSDGSAKSCGHRHQCRCAVKLTRPNPFQAQLVAAQAAEPEQEGTA